ncbi:hypothetical protein [Pseudomonas fragi]|uniref:hypothetical protein n=1 Tax=Pseudomonas fragi TaxID=296 RepID=UPI000BA295E5|nr:hypothetical protein [Pseudomonas fragi]PAA14434.1 hypothetical protein CJU74_15105 [Pseudomonas fragi]
MEHLKRSIFSLWFLLVCIVFVSALLASYFYWTMFGSQLSSVSSDWSAFGSYFGGVFGPLISFCTLLAVLKTVYLQRELLDAQKNEFNSLNKLQGDTLTAQRDQLDLAKSDSNKSELRAYKTSQINLLEMFIEHRLRVVEGVEKQIAEVNSATSLTIDSRRTKLSSLNGELTKANDAANGLLILAFNMSITQFENIAGVNQVLSEKLPELLGLNLSS